MYSFNFVTCLTSHFLFFHISEIHLVNASTEWNISNAIWIIKASWRHRLTNQLSLLIQRLAVSGPRYFQNFSSHLNISQFYKFSYTAAIRYRRVPNCSACIFQSKQKNGCKCGKRFMTNMGNYYITHAVCTFKITCNAQACNNFEFTFQLMTVALLNTKGFQNLKYCIRSKRFLEHPEAFLYPTDHDISMFGLLSSYRYQWCQVACMWSDVIVL